jgi:hypothetical protein
LGVTAKNGLAISAPSGTAEYPHFHHRQRETISDLFRATLFRYGIKKGLLAGQPQCVS